MNNRGVAIYLAVIMMFVLLGIGLGLSTLLVGQIKSIERVGNSVTAFYATDTGIERELYETKTAGEKTQGTEYYGFLDIDGDGTAYDPSDVCPDDLTSGDACYIVSITSDNPYTVESIGIYKGVRRAVEVSFTLLGGVVITSVDSSVSSVGFYSSIAIPPDTAPDQFPVISYQDSTNRDLKVVKCGNAECSTGNTITTVDSGGFVGAFTSIAIGTDNFPVIAYFDATNDMLKVAKQVALGVGTGCAVDNWTCTTVALGSLGAGGDQKNISIAIGTDGFPVISYMSFLSLKVAKQVAPGAGTGCAVDNWTCTTIVATGFNASITIGTDDFPIISYYDSINQNLKVAKQVAPGAGTGCAVDNWTCTIAEIGPVSVDTSIAIGTDGFPVISYALGGGVLDDLLRVAKQVLPGTGNCTGNNWECTTIDIIGDVNAFTSLAIGSDDFPVISYYFLTPIPSQLRVAKCGNAECSAGNIINTLEVLTNTPVLGTSIAISPDGFPIISYRGNDADLRVAKCYNLACTP